jgi:hypothetical protein
VGGGPDGEARADTEFLMPIARPMLKIGQGNGKLIYRKATFTFTVRSV